MARNKGELLHCINATLHHLCPVNIRNFFIMQKDVDAQVYRLELIRDEVETVKKQVEKIKKIAEEKRYQEILDILKEEVEFGHDSSSVSI